jgi:hypothetical protein
MNQVAKSLARTTLLASLVGFAFLLLLRALSGKWFWETWLLPPVAAGCAVSGVHFLVERKPSKKALGWTLFCAAYLVSFGALLLYHRLGMVASGNVIGKAGLFSAMVAGYIRAKQVLMGKPAEVVARSSEVAPGREVGANGSES